MKITPENQKDIAAIIAAEFPSFGGGRYNAYDPISIALKDSKPQFAAGVEIEKVVTRVIELQKKIKK